MKFSAQLKTSVFQMIIVFFTINYMVGNFPENFNLLKSLFNRLVLNYLMLYVKNNRFIVMSLDDMGDMVT